MQKNISANKITFMLRIMWSQTSCLSVRPHGTTRLPRDGFSWNSILEYLSKICREKSSFIKTWQE